MPIGSRESKPVFASVQDLCAGEAHGCEQLCVAMLGSIACQCFRGYELAPDGKHCVGEYRPIGLGEEGQRD